MTASNILSSLLEQAKEMKSQLDVMRPISPENEKRIFDKFRLDWNYHSNHIEGNSLTYWETKMLLFHGITSWWKPLRDSLEMQWHNEALKWILDVVNWEYPLTETFIRELNEKILWEPYEIDAITPNGKSTRRLITPGKYKTDPNHVLTKTGEIFRFSEPFEVSAKMHDLIDWYRDEKDKNELNPIFLATEFHYRFIRIHPFDDWNGRTARILMNFILMQLWYPPAIIKTEEKDSYYSVLRLADSGDLSWFLEYIAREVIRSLEIMIRWISGESIEDEDDIDKEIRLLKWEVWTYEKKKFVSKEEKIKYVLTETIIPFVQLTFNSLKDFEDFYHYPIWLSAMAKYEKSHWFNISDSIIQQNNTIVNSPSFIEQKSFSGEDIFDVNKFLLPWQLIEELYFNMNYTGLNAIGESQWISYLFQIKIGFSSENYYQIDIAHVIVWTNKYNDIYRLKKIYLETISDDEKNTIMKLAKQDHLDFIKSHKQ